MSLYVTPFLVLNLGAEMVYVIAQRLQAQNVPQDKATIVLNEIISVLLSKHLITEIMKPQPTYSHEAVREIIEDVTQSSVMRLDSNSMNKLWDLITMVFKWQVTLNHELIKITSRHLYEIETYINNPDIQLQLHKIQTIVENFDKILNQNEKNAAREETLIWLKDYNVRVSLLLRMGLQNMDGSFIVNNINPIAQRMLKNLGENIYSVTQNGKIIENQQHQQEEEDEVNGNEKSKDEIGELQLFVEQMLGDRKNNSSNNEQKILRLSINEQTGGKANLNTVLFDNIEVTTQDHNKLQDILNDMNLLEDLKISNFKDDLLDMIGTED